MLQDQTTVMDKLREAIESKRTVTLELDTRALTTMYTALLDNNIMADMVKKACAENPNHQPKDVNRILNSMKTEDGVSFREIHLDYNSSCDDVVMTLAAEFDKVL